MKVRSYAIILLLSFLIVLSHEMIPHHHHDTMALVSYVKEDHNMGHEHMHQHKEKHHHEHKPQQKEKNPDHNRQFPFHQHITATNKVFIERTNLLESNIQLRDVNIFACTQCFRAADFKPPNPETKPGKEPPNLLPILVYLETFALRGPPAFV